MLAKTLLIKCISNTYFKLGVQIYKHTLGN